MNFILYITHISKFSKLKKVAAEPENFFKKNINEFFNIYYTYIEIFKFEKSSCWTRNFGLN